MTTSTITTLLTTPVVLGTGQYGSTLTITSTGGVEPATSNAAAISAPASLAGVRIENAGTLIGGSGYQGSQATGYGGGDGLALYATATVRNTGQISGGQAGSAMAGGVGVLLSAGGALVNSGNIAGGSGGGNYTLGGSGVQLNAPGTVVNTGTISGGASVQGAPYPVEVGGYGVYFASSGTLMNAGTITGGTSLAQGVWFRGSGDVENRGTIIGGKFGGAGLDLSAGGTLANTGTIAGGYGRDYSNAYGQPGGTGVMLANGVQATNQGAIDGGRGGQQSGTVYAYIATVGGTGVALASGASLNNGPHGVITGGAGGYSSLAGAGAAGGIGVALGSGTTVSNRGAIVGGAGGSNTGAHTTALGGDGATIGAGAVLVNTGSIEGGTGGFTTRHSGVAGGAGVSIDGGTLIARGGTIAGGTGLYGAPRGDAVQFGSAAGTLVLYARANFSGNIAANAAAHDTLVLAGATTGTLTGFGSNVSGFTTISEQSGAHWHLSGNIAGSGTLTIGSQGFLALAGSVSLPTLDFATGGHAALQLAHGTTLASTIAGFGPGDTIDLAGLAATTLHYNAGTLTLLNAAHQVVDRLHFTGDFKTADFGLLTVPNGTEITYTGPNAYAGASFGRPEPLLLTGHVPHFWPGMSAFG